MKSSHSYSRRRSQALRQELEPKWGYSTHGQTDYKIIDSSPERRSWSSPLSVGVTDAGQSVRTGMVKAQANKLQLQSLRNERRTLSKLEMSLRRLT